MIVFWCHKLKGTAHIIRRHEVYYIENFLRWRWYEVLQCLTNCYRINVVYQILSVILLWGIQELSKNDIVTGVFQNIHQLLSMRFLPNCQLPVPGLCPGQNVGQYIPHRYYRIIYTAPVCMWKSIAITGIRENNIPIWFTVMEFYLQSDG